MSQRPARHVIETMLSIPWALSEDYARKMLSIASREGDPAAIAAERGKALEHTREVTVRNGIATIPMVGPMFRYADLFAEISGATSYEALAQDITTALRDPQVRAILLDVDSPGGEAFGAGEIADLLYNARGTKPIVAHVGGFCASAALWVASAADEVVLSSVAVAGSVGAAMSITVPDAERQAELFGEREVEFVSSQSPDKNVDPTSKAGRDQYQAIVDAIAGVFGADLARNFGISEQAVWSQFGQGKLFVGAAAVQRGMAHRVATFEATHRALVQRVEGRSVLPFRSTAAAERPATSATVLAHLFQSLNLTDAIRPAAALRATRRVLSGPTPTVITSDGEPVAPSPAPRADYQEDRTMSDTTPAAPVSGVDELARYKQRVATITNLCVVAGYPGLAPEFLDTDLSETEIREKLLAKKKEDAGEPEAITVPTADPKITVGADRAAEKPFASLGEQLAAIAASYAPSGVKVGGFKGGTTDPRLPRIAAEVSGASTQSGGDGGWLIQKDFTVDLMKEGFESGALASRCSTTEIGANADGLEVVQIDEKSRATGSRWGGVQIYRVDEAGTATKSKPKTQKWECRLEDLMGIAYMTERLLQDAPAMAQVFSEAFTEEFGFVLDDEIFRGTGAGQCLGVLNAPATVSQAKETGQLEDTIVAENVINMWARVLPRSKARGVWFVNTECTPQLHQMQIGTGTSGQLVYMPPGGLSGSPYGSIYGRPVIEIEQASALGDVGDITFLDLSQYKVITKGGIQASESIHVRFIYNERTFRWVSRVNGAPKFNSAITPYKGANPLSPFVTLAARA